MARRNGNLEGGRWTMTIGTWWLFVGVVFVVSATPGPNMLHIMQRSVQFGVLRSTVAMAGCMTAVLIALFASAAGLGAVLTASPRLFGAVRYAGVAYLVWLGISSWRRASRAHADGVAPAEPADAPAFRLYRDALFTGLSNPKLIVFAAALFPQFVDAHRAWAPQFAILVATFVAIETGWYFTYALGGRRLAAWMSTAARRRMFDRATGAIFVGFAFALLSARV
jgi:homoserine/homoserine lactone efflux protein